ncbi:MAG: hypothetical protein ABGX71_05000, partial [Methyloprofundus sp.]
MRFLAVLAVATYPYLTFLCLAKTRHQFRKAIKQVHAVMRQLKLTLHKKQKCFIGKTETGFD